MFDILLIINLFLLASFLLCLLTLRLSISIKHLSLFSFITGINGFSEIPTPSPPPCIRHLRVVKLYEKWMKSFSDFDLVYSYGLSCFSEIPKSTISTKFSELTLQPVKQTLREKCSNAELFLVRSFLYFK